MDNFFLYESGVLKKKDNSVVYETQEKEYLIPVEQIDAIYCLGEVTVNKRLLELLNKYGIEILFFNYYGNLIGRFQPNLPGTGMVFMEQVHCYNNYERRLKIAYEIQKASLHNSVSVLKYYRKNGVDLGNQIEELQKILENLGKSKDIEDLLLKEARAKKIYYSGFDVILRDSPFRFIRRTTQPPENEVNSMMSFGYHLLYGLILKELDMSQLYPEIAFIHSDIRKGPSLHYDLADIYKPFMIDRMFLRMIRRHQLTPDDFESRNPGIYLKKQSQKKCLTEFDLEIKRTVEYGGRELSRKSIIKRDIHKLIKYIEGETDELVFYLSRW